MLALVVLLLLMHHIPAQSHQHGMRGPHHPRGTGTVMHQHYRPQRSNDQGPAPKLTQDTELLHDTEHIQEDLGDMISKEDTRKMSPEELEFHYFKLHDFDNNTKLDGLEILQAIHHTVHYEDDLSEDTKSELTEEQSIKQKKDDLDDFNYFVGKYYKEHAQVFLTYDNCAKFLSYLNNYLPKCHKFINFEKSDRAVNIHFVIPGSNISG